MSRAEDSSESPIEVGIAIVLRDDAIADPKTGDQPPILVTQRREETVYGGYWEFPGGKVEDGEAIDDCVTREVREEVGIDVEVIHNLETVVHTYEHGTVRLHPRVCRRVDPSQTPTPIEVASVEWRALAEFESLRFLPANESILTALSAWLASGVSPRR